MVSVLQVRGCTAKEVPNLEPDFKQQLKGRGNRLRVVSLGSMFSMNVKHLLSVVLALAICPMAGLGEPQWELLAEEEGIKSSVATGQNHRCQYFGVPAMSTLNGTMSSPSSMTSKTTIPGCMAVPNQGSYRAGSLAPSFSIIELAHHGLCGTEMSSSKRSS